MASFVLPIISGLAGLFGGGSKQTQTQQQQSQSTQSQNGQSQTAGYTNPNLSPIQQQLLDSFSSGSENFASKAPDLTGYEQGGLQQIQQQGSANSAAMANQLASRGLSYSPAAGTALGQQQINTGNQENTFAEQIPLLQRQLQQQGLQQLIQAFQVQPTATSTGGNTQTSSTGTTNSSSSGSSTGTGQAGGQAGNAISGVGAALAGPTSGVSNLSSILNSIGFGGSQPSSGGDKGLNNLPIATTPYQTLNYGG